MSCGREPEKAYSSESRRCFDEPAIDNRRQIPMPREVRETQYPHGLLACLPHQITHTISRRPSLREGSAGSTATSCGHPCSFGSTFTCGHSELRLFVTVMSAWPPFASNLGTWGVAGRLNIYPLKASRRWNQLGKDSTPSRMLCRHAADSQAKVRHDVPRSVGSRQHFRQCYTRSVCCHLSAATTSHAPRASMNITQSSVPSQRATCLALLIKAKKEPGAKRCSLPSTTSTRIPATVVT